MAAELDAPVSTPRGRGVQGGQAHLPGPAVQFPPCGTWIVWGDAAGELSRHRADQSRRAAIMAGHGLPHPVARDQGDPPLREDQDRLPSRGQPSNCGRLVYQQRPHVPTPLPDGGLKLLVELTLDL